jgi:hypothetical protein
MTKPIVPREQLASEADRLREAVNAYRAQKPAAEPPQSAKPQRRRRAPADRPTPIDGYPFNDSSPAEIPDYGTMARVQAIKRRQRKIGAQLPIAGEPQLIKKGDVRTGRAAK